MSKHRYDDEETIILDALTIPLDETDLDRYETISSEFWNLSHLFLIADSDSYLDQLKNNIGVLMSNYTFMNNSQEHICKFFESVLLSTSQRKRVPWLLGVLGELEIDCIQGLNIVQSFPEIDLQTLEFFVAGLNVSRINLYLFFIYVADHIRQFTSCGKLFFDKLIDANREDVFVSLPKLDTVRANRIFGLISKYVKEQFISDYVERYAYFGRETIDEFKYKLFEFPFMNETIIPFIVRLLNTPFPVYRDTFVHENVTSYITTLLFRIENIVLLVDELGNLSWDWKRSFDDVSVAYLIEERIQNSHSAESVVFLIKTFSETKHIDMNKVFANVRGVCLIGKKK